MNNFVSHLKDKKIQKGKITKTNKRAVVICLNCNYTQELKGRKKVDMNKCGCGGDKILKAFGENLAYSIAIKKGGLV